MASVAPETATPHLAVDALGTFRREAKYRVALHHLSQGGLLILGYALLPRNNQPA